MLLAENPKISTALMKSLSFFELECLYKSKNSISSISNQF